MIGGAKKRLALRRSHPQTRVVVLTLRRPVSPPHAIQPCSEFHDRHLSFTPLGMATFLLK